MTLTVGRLQVRLVRPPVSADQKHTNTNFIADPRQAEGTPVGTLVKGFSTAAAARMPALLREFIASKGFDLNFPKDQDRAVLSRVLESVARASRQMNRRHPSSHV